jgi:hypothetical protein
MMSEVFTLEEEIRTLEPAFPHVVLLGAGASLAAFPNGERNGKLLPLMSNFVEVVGLEGLLKSAGISPPYSNFENLYASLYEQEEKRDFTLELEDKIYQYFAKMEICEEPTIYDVLLLSLREKDVIATFNWDPFLWQAYSRNYHYAELPHILFLHGNVAVGFCKNCHAQGPRGRLCSGCRRPFRPSHLLYPITKKNYASDSFISSAWSALKDAMKRAWALTIFGYGAPVSDTEAVGLLSNFWGSPSERRLEEIEIIDILDDTALSARWNRFILSHHYRTATTFYDSLLAKHPRRTSEALWANLMEARAVEDMQIPTGLSFKELYDLLSPRVEAEKKGSIGTKQYFRHGTA